MRIECVYYTHFYRIIQSDLYNLILFAYNDNYMIELVVRALIKDAEGQLLLVKRAKEPEIYKWSLPGGKVELEETAEEAIKREIEEELNLEFEPKYVTHSQNISPYLHCHITYYEGKTTGMMTVKEDEIAEVRYVPYQEIQNMDDIAWDHKEIIEQYYARQAPVAPIGRAGIDYIGVTTPFYCNDGSGRFLLHKRSEQCRDEQLRWDFGGGALEFGEEVTASVLREVREEYGCEGVIQEQLPAHSVIREHEGQKTHWLAIPFFIKVDPSKVQLNEMDKMIELGWFTLDALPSPLHSGVEYTMEQYKKYFNKYREYMPIQDVL
ncbi:MAG: hypothetical protein RI947_1216 [Candidatus Parcubacteria bacterium]